VALVLLLDHPGSFNAPSQIRVLVMIRGVAGLIGAAFAPRSPVVAASEPNAFQVSPGGRDLAQLSRDGTSLHESVVLLAGNRTFRCRQSEPVRGRCCSRTIASRFGRLSQSDALPRVEPWGFMPASVLSIVPCRGQMTVQGLAPDALSKA